MKRIAMALAAAMLLGLCACGQEAEPVTTTESVTTTATTTTETATTTEPETTIEAQPFTPAEPNLEPLILSVIQADIDGWAYAFGHEQPEPKDLGTQVVVIGKAISFSTKFGDAKLTVTSFDTEAVTVHFQTNRMVKQFNNMLSDEYDWVAVIPYGESYDIFSQSVDLFNGLIFTFTKNSP